MESPTTSPRPQWRAWLWSHRVVLGVVLGLAAVSLWAYWPTLAAVARKWVGDPQYSHGYLVPAFALFLLWWRRSLLAKVTFGFRWWGVALVAAGALMRVAAAFLYFDWLDAFSLLPCVAGLFVLLGGLPALRWSWPAVAFLVFMIPLPYKLETALALPLQRLATVSSTYLLQTIGLTAVAEGTTIHTSKAQIGVVEACSGLSMLLVFFAISTGMVLVVKRPWLDKAIILASAIPVAVVANVLRITGTSMLYEWVNEEVGKVFFHDLAGWLMMPLAILILWGELKLISFLLVRPEANEPAPLAFAPAPVTAAQAPPVRKGRRRARTGA